MFTIKVNINLDRNNSARRIASDMNWYCIDIDDDAKIACVTHIMPLLHHEHPQFKKDADLVLYVTDRSHREVWLLLEKYYFNEVFKIGNAVDRPAFLTALLNKDNEALLLACTSREYA